jgi:AraC-like DNA-binding protein
MEIKEVTNVKKVEGFCEFCAQSESNCAHLISLEESGFKEINLLQGEIFSHDNIDFYLICFVLTGECRLACQDGKETILPSNSMILFGQGDTIFITAKEDSSFIFFMFDRLPDFCENIKLESYIKYCKKKESYTPTIMNPTINIFLEECLFFVKHGMLCRKFFNIKQSEFFYIMAVLYSPFEMATFLHPIIGRFQDFKAVVLRNYSMSITAVDLMKRTGYCRNLFYKRFKEEFGMPVKEWIVKQRIGQMHIIAMEPLMTAKQMMHRCGFLSPGHFAQFCKRHTQMTPTELINSLKTIENDN